MKNSKSILITISLIFGIVIFSNFQNKTDEYRIVDGFVAYWPNETATYYAWDGKQSVQISDRYELIRVMATQGFELVSTHAVQTSNSGGFTRFKETWIFKK